MSDPKTLRGLLWCGVCAAALAASLPAAAQETVPEAEEAPAVPVDETAPEPLDPGFRLAPITITATRTPMPLTRVPASVSILEGEALEVLQPNDLEDLLFGLPNVSVQLGPRGAGQQPLIRGLGAERVVVLVDGARQSFQSGHNGRFVIDPELIGRVEVVRGTGSALYGSGALGGVLSFQTIRPRDLLGAEDGFGGWVRGSYSSADQGLGGSVVVFGRSGGFEALLAGSYRNTDDIRLGDGSTLPYSSLETRDFLAQFAITLGRGHRLEFGAEAYYDNGVAPDTLESDTTSASALTDRTAERTTVRLGYSWEGEHRWWWDPRVTIYSTSYEVEQRYLASGSTTTRTVDTYGIDASNTFALDLHETVALDFTVGVDYFTDQNRGNLDGGTLASYPDGEGSFTGLYAQAEFRLFDRVSIIPGIRWDSFEMTSDDPGNERRSGEEWSPKLAVSADVTDFLTLWGSYAEGFNAPRHQYLYMSGLHFPGFGLQPCPPPMFFQGLCMNNNRFVANPDLQPERSTTWEVGARLALDDLVVRGDRLTAEVTYFDTRATDFINVTVDVINGITYYDNLDRVRLRGIEAGVRYDHPRWFAGLSYGQVRARQDNGGWVDSVPGDQWTAEAGLRFFDGDLTVGWRTSFVEAQNRVNDVYSARDSYWVNDAYAFWNLDDWRPDTRVELRVNNIFDQAYMPSGAYVLNPGIDARLALRVGF